MNTLKLALEALQSCKDKRDVLDWHQVFDTKLVNGAIEKLQAEIARYGEAVAWVHISDTHENPYLFNGKEYLPPGKHLLFTHTAPKPKPLSDDEIHNGFDETYSDDFALFCMGARFAEKHHGIGGDV